MELTKEYFEKHLDETLTKKLDGFVTKEHFDIPLGEISDRLDRMATKADLDLLRQATKEDLKEQSRELMAYTDSVAETIIEAVDLSINKIDKRLRVVEARS